MAHHITPLATRLNYSAGRLNVKKYPVKKSEIIKTDTFGLRQTDKKTGKKIIYKEVKFY